MLRGDVSLVREGTAPVRNGKGILSPDTKNIMQTKTQKSGTTKSRNSRNATKPAAKATKPAAKRTATKRKAKGLTPKRRAEIAQVNARLQADPKGLRLFKAIPPTKAGAVDATTRRAFMAWFLDCKVGDLTGDQATNQATALVKDLRKYRAELTVEVIQKQASGVESGQLSQELTLGFNGNVDSPDGIAFTQKVVTKKTGFKSEDLFHRLNTKTVGAEKYVL